MCLDLVKRKVDDVIWDLKERGGGEEKLFDGILLVSVVIESNGSTTLGLYLDEKLFKKFLDLRYKVSMETYVKFRNLLLDVLEAKEKIIREDLDSLKVCDFIQIFVDEDNTIDCKIDKEKFKLLLFQYDKK